MISDRGFGIFNDRAEPLTPDNANTGKNTYSKDTSMAVTNAWPAQSILETH